MAEYTPVETEEDQFIEYIRYVLRTKPLSVSDVVFECRVILRRFVRLMYREQESERSEVMEQLLPQRCCSRSRVWHLPVGF